MKDTELIPAAEAQAMIDGATDGDWGITSDEGPVTLPGGEKAERSWTYSICAHAGPPRGNGSTHVCIGQAFSKHDGAPRHDAELMASAKALAKTVVALEAQRDAALAKLGWAMLSVRFVAQLASVHEWRLEDMRCQKPHDDSDRDALERYGSLICEMRFSPGVPKLHVIAAEMGVDVADFIAVESFEAAPFDDAITRKACEACGYDPQPLLDAAVKIREMLREPEKT